MQFATERHGPYHRLYIKMDNKVSTIQKWNQNITDTNIALLILYLFFLLCLVLIVFLCFMFFVWTYISRKIPGNKHFLILIAILCIWRENMGQSGDGAVVARSRQYVCLTNRSLSCHSLSLLSFGELSCHIFIYSYYSTMVWVFILPSPPGRSISMSVVCVLLWNQWMTRLLLLTLGPLLAYIPPHTPSPQGVQCSSTSSWGLADI